MIPISKLFKRTTATEYSFSHSHSNHLSGARSPSLVVCLDNIMLKLLNTFTRVYCNQYSVSFPAIVTSDSYMNASTSPSQAPPHSSFLPQSQIFTLPHLKVKAAPAQAASNLSSSPTAGRNPDAELELPDYQSVAFHLTFYQQSISTKYQHPQQTQTSPKYESDIFRFPPCSICTSCQVVRCIFNHPSSGCF